MRLLVRSTRSLVRLENPQSILKPKEQKAVLYETHNKKKKEERKPTKTTINGIDQLIDKMSKLSVDDPGYARAFFKALLTNPKITQIFEKPRKESTTGNNRILVLRNLGKYYLDLLPMPLEHPLTPLPNHPLTTLDLFRRGELVYNQREELGLPGYLLLIRKTPRKPRAKGKFAPNYY
ncbi:hypothetical protein J3R82DRAFT_8699 [Butyriboletus roseoflavus]|nr:hypothetical protein J3R82DRAFT_8699 [Butyriboletus roseoflavus]